MDRKTKAKRKQFLSIYLPSIIVKTPLAKVRIEDKKFIEDFDDIINSAVQDKVNDILRLDQPYPLKDILEVLTKAADILLNEKDYDGDGWENIAKVLLITKVIRDKGE